MKLYRHRIIRRFKPGLNAFLLQRSILGIYWCDVKINGKLYYDKRSEVIALIEDEFYNQFKKHSDWTNDIVIWPKKYYDATDHQYD